MKCTCSTISESNVIVFVNNSFTFFQVGLLCLISLQYQLSFIDSSLGLTPGDVDYISHSCQKEKPVLLKRKLHELHSYVSQHNQSIHVTVGMPVMSLSASLLQKTSAARDFLCQIMLNQKLSCKFWSRIKVKSLPWRASWPQQLSVNFPGASWCTEIAHREVSCHLSYGAFLLTNCYQGSMGEVSVLKYMWMTCLLAVGKFPNMVSGLTQWALRTTEMWCDELGLSVNRNKTGLVAFTSRRNSQGSLNHIFLGTTLHHSVSQVSWSNPGFTADLEEACRC